MMPQTGTYRKRSREFLAKACQELDREVLAKACQELDEDLPQASEKGWGAAALMVKAIAERRGWDHRSHRLLYDAVDDLADETGDDELNRLFRLAGSLHVNFYEDLLRRRGVREGIQDVERFVERVERLLPDSQPWGS